MKKILFLGLTLINGFLSAQVGIGTKDPKATLDVNGNVIIRKTENLMGDNIQPLYINNEGLIGLTSNNSTDVTTKVFSAVAYKTNIDGSADQLKAFNEGNYNYIFLEDSFIKENTLNIKSTGENYKFTESGTFLINLYINFRINVEADGDAYILAELQIKKDGSSTWKTVLANRHVVDSKGGSQVHRPLTFPNQILKIEKNDEIRIRFRRTATAGAPPTLQGSNLTYLKVTAGPIIEMPGLSIIINKI